VVQKTRETVEAAAAIEAVAAIAAVVVVAQFATVRPQLCFLLQACSIF